MIKSPFQIKNNLKTPSAFDMARGYSQITELVAQLETLKKEHTSHLEKNTDTFNKSLDKKIKEVEEQLANLFEFHTNEFKKVVSQVQQVLEEMSQIDFTGKPGDAGVSPSPVDEKALEERIYSRIRQPKDGNTPIIDEDRIAKKASKLVKRKEGRPGKDAKIDHDLLAEKMIEILQSGKLKAKHITDLKDSITENANVMFQRFLARGSVRGGGDTVAAGTGVTITNSNGVKTISSTGGGGSGYQTPTGTVNSVNKVFVFATAPSAIVVDGVSLRKTASDGTVNWTGTTTVTLLVAPNFDVYAIG